jgi:hypothetical protein
MYVVQTFGVGSQVCPKQAPEEWPVVRNLEME